MLKLLNVSASDEICDLWLKLFCLKFTFQLSQARDLCLDSNRANHFCNGVGKHDPVRTKRMRSVLNTNQPKEINFSNTGELWYLLRTVLTMWEEVRMTLFQV